MKSIRHLDEKYAALFGIYNFIFAAFGSYGTVYLLDNNFNEGQIGLIVSGANITAAILQPLIATWADESERWTLKEFTSLLILPAIILLGSLLFGNWTGWAIGIQFMIAQTMLFVMQPLLNVISMFFTNLGYPINFGFGRAIGSLFYAIGSSILGYLTVAFGMNSVISFALAGFAVTIAILQFFPFKQAKENPKSQRPLEEVEDTDIFPLDITDVPLKETFFKKYPQFKYILGGVTLFFAFHNVVNVFMFHILKNVGGGAKELGIAFAIGALVEMPLMMFYNRIRQYFADQQAMMISALGFLVKSILALIASSVMGIYFAQFSQMFAFGLYAAASVYYTNDIMQEEDKVKGQALLTTCHTIGGVLGAMMGGQIITNLGVPAVLYFNVFLSIGGVILFWLALKDDLKRKDIKPL